ncbi:MAG: CRTAC1 family protein, partial [Spirochaetaceae bacterium]|nr:CRTAC1 family protein [Spirochaetaceae bacterium]
TRGVFLVDENADGALDLVFTRPHTPPQLWHGDGDGTFAPADRFGAWYPAMTMAWADADRDGDLDIASATYDAEMVEEMGNVLFGSGVVYYERAAGRLEPRSLVNTAEALALLFTDLDGDGLADILVGNDFDREDYVYLRRGDGWEPAEPFAATARNTMSFDLADLDNDGSEELFAADMKPFHPDAATEAAWEPVYRYYEKPPRGSLQINENVLLRRTASGEPGGGQLRFANEAAARGVDATGWSWSAKFGDLDNDGFLDLYVVNGMIAADMFGHLPGNELVEENLAFRNDGTGHFSAAPEWGLGDTAGGRGMSMADFDRDGDLDIVINNIGAAAVLYENRLCGGRGAQVALRWPGSANPFAVGARLYLESAQGVQTRELRSGSGYLSGDPPEAHFGLGGGHLPGGTLTVLWPDGVQAAFAAPAAGTRAVITREQEARSLRDGGRHQARDTGIARASALSGSAQ